MGDSRLAASCALRAMAVLVLCGTVAPKAVAADPPAAGSTSVFCSVEGNSFMDALTCEFGGGSGIPSYARAEAIQSPVPSVVAEAQASATANLGAGSSATALYRFQVVGPADGVDVPLLIDYRLTATGTNDAVAIARIIINAGTTFSGVEACSDFRPGSLCDGPTDEQSTFRLTVKTGSRFDSVTLYAEAQAAVTGFSQESALALSDPYIHVDPAFADAALYSVLVSPGFGNAPPVPEPAALWLLVPGLLWLRWPAQRLRGGEASCAGAASLAGGMAAADRRKNRYALATGHLRAAICTRGGRARVAAERPANRIRRP
jgi:hypothetical protein